MGWTIESNKQLKFFFMLVSFNCIFRRSYKSLAGITTITSVLELSDRDNKCIELLIPLLPTVCRTRGPSYSVLRGAIRASSWESSRGQGV